MAFVVVGALLSSATAHAQAEAAPENYEPPSGMSMSSDPTTTHEEQAATDHLWSITVDPRLVIALGTPAGLPRVGFGAGGTIGRMLVVRGRMRFGLQLAFSYDRVQHNHFPSEPLALSESTQYLGQASFTLDLRLEALLQNGLIRPWIAIGPGLSIADYQDGASAPDPNGIKDVTVVAALRAGLGVAFRVWRNVELGPRFEFLATFGGPQVGSEKLSVFTPGNFSVGLDLGFRL